MPNKKSLNFKQGDIALVTGASSGIGEAFARSLASIGYNLVLTARRRELLIRLKKDLESEYGIDVKVIAADLSCESGLKIVERYLSDNKKIDFLANCAGFGTRDLFFELGPEKISRMIFLHTLALARITRGVLPAMIERGRGYIVNVSSLASFYTAPRYLVYSATKSFVNMFSKGLNLELAHTGVAVQALCPGLTKTGFMTTDEFLDFSYDAIPDFAWMKAEEVVNESLNALAGGKIIFVPGYINRAFVGLMESPILGRLFTWILGKLAEGRY
jgi:hypothetical protein